MMDDLKLKKVDQNKWLHNILVFLSPVLIIYIVAIVGLIQAHNGSVRATDFVPNSFTLGAMTLYILNTILDYLRKLNQ